VRKVKVPMAHFHHTGRFTTQGCRILVSNAYRRGKKLRRLGIQTRRTHFTRRSRTIQELRRKRWRWTGRISRLRPRTLVIRLVHYFVCRIFADAGRVATSSNLPPQASTTLTTGPRRNAELQRMSRRPKMSGQICALVQSHLGPPG
jgi:hypothetical protein